MRRCLLLLGAAAVATFVALCPYTDALADDSFAWHMAQHMVLLFVVPPLILLAEPFTVVNASLPKATTASLLRMTAPLRTLVTPGGALLIFVAVLWVTHFSAWYERSLENEVVHASEHLVYLAAGLLFWTPVIAPAPMSRTPYAARLLYLLIVLPQGALLAFALDGAKAPLYPHYAHALGTTAALADQSNGAAVMWIVGGLILFAAFLATLGAWAARERRALAYTLPENVR